MINNAEDTEGGGKQTQSHTKGEHNHEGNDSTQNNLRKFRRVVTPPRLLFIKTITKQKDKEPQDKSVLAKQPEQTSNPKAAMILGFVRPPLARSQSLTSSTTQQLNTSTSQTLISSERSNENECEVNQSNVPCAMILGLLKPSSTTSQELKVMKPQKNYYKSRKRTQSGMQKLYGPCSHKPTTTELQSDSIVKQDPVLSLQPTTSPRPECHSSSVTQASFSGTQLTKSVGSQVSSSEITTFLRPQASNFNVQNGPSLDYQSISSHNLNQGHNSLVKQESYDLSSPPTTSTSLQGHNSFHIQYEPGLGSQKSIKQEPALSSQSTTSAKSHDYNLLVKQNTSLSQSSTSTQCKNIKFEPQEPTSFITQNHNLPLIKSSSSTISKQPSPPNNEHDNNSAPSTSPAPEEENLKFLLALSEQKPAFINLMEESFSALQELTLKSENANLVNSLEENHCSIHKEMYTIDDKPFLHNSLANYCVLHGKPKAVKLPSTSCSQDSTEYTLNISSTIPYEPSYFTFLNAQKQIINLSLARTSTCQDIVFTISQGFQSGFSENSLYSSAQSSISCKISTSSYSDINGTTLCSSRRYTSAIAHEFDPSRQHESMTFMRQELAFDSLQGANATIRNEFSNTMTQRYAPYVVPAVSTQSTYLRTETAPMAAGIMQNNDAFFLRPRPPRRRVANQRAPDCNDVSPVQLPQVESLFEGDLGMDTALFPELYI